jgi:Fungal specific transcription factor domain
MYIYLVLANCVIPYGIMDSRHVPYDSFLDNLVSTMSTYDTFGIMFAGCHRLFQMIPAISRFAARQLEAEKDEAGNAERLLKSEAFYTSTKSRIRDWHQRELGSAEGDWDSKRLVIGETYRHALFVYLETAVLGTAGLPASADMQIELHEYITHIAEAVEGHNLVTLPFATIILWPMVIAGSVLTQAPEREMLLRGLRAPEYTTCNSIQTAKLLELVWEDKDPRSFGPYGLYLAMEKHEINLCLS